MNLKDISKKRQKKWKDTDLYKVKEDTSKPKFYILDMFPYPSGSALHVGHPKGYIATDCLARKKMLEGFNVLHPMGFDTFGLGTEQYAIEHKMKPQDVAKENIAKFISQLENFGTTYDRSRSVNTADPKYFKRTQRVFLQFYNHYYDEQAQKAKPIEELKLKIENGELKINEDIEKYLNRQRLAYVDYKPINRCPHCMTGLANEDLDDGKCERCGSEVEQKPMKQRVLRITKYADRLLQGLNDLQRDESMKDLERNRIGKSEGTEFAMQVDGMDEKFSVYTTRIDTVFGMSFVAIAPEHPLVEKITTKDFTKEVEKYKEAANKKSQLERTELQKDKTGVFCGAYAINPFNGEEVPVFVADYVLANYGTGVVMAVPAHDERDFEFAKKYDLPIKQSIMFVDQIPNAEAERRHTISAIIHRPIDNKFLFLKWKKFGWVSPVVGGIEGDEDILRAAEREVLEETGYTAKAIRKIGRLTESNFFAENKNIRRQRIDQPIVLELVNDKPTGVDPEEMERHEAVRLTYDEAIAQTTHKDNLFGLTAYVKGETAFGDYGRLINSDNSQPQRNVLILHGTEGDSKKNRYPRLQKKLETLGHNVIVPDLPSSDLPELNVRLEHLEQYKDLIDENSIIIGHSLGAPTALQFLQKYNKKIDRLILIAPTHSDVDRKEYNKKVPSYNNANIQKVSQTKTNRKKIKSLVQHIDCFFSEDDPYIPMEVKKFYERDLGAHSIVFKDKGHFNMSGLKSEEFPELLNFIEASYPTQEAISFNGMMSEEAIPAMQKWLEKKGIGGVKVNYKMQDRVFSRQRYRGEPFPILRIEDGKMEKLKDGKIGSEKKIIALDEKELPLLLPDVENYEPTGTEEGPLANITDWVNVTLPDGTKAKRETNTMPGRSGSSRYWLRYMDPTNDKAIVGKDKEKYRGSVDVYVGGAEHITRHMIYGRFWQKFLFDIGAITHEEPFQEYHSVGLIMGEDGRKMSKRRGNVVNPDDIINEFGTDVLRAYEMFMGPFDQSIAWSTAGMSGTKKFLDKVILLKDKIDGNLPTSDNDMDETTRTILHQTIKKVGENINEFRFNTAISQLMILTNHLTEVGKLSRTAFERLVVLVSAFAPHLAEELREQLGNEYSVFTKAKWPTYDEKYLVADTVTIGVQVNGKVRGTITISKEAEENEVMKLAKADEKINSWIVNEPKKIIYVKGKILNIVV